MGRNILLIKIQGIRANHTAMMIVNIYVILSDNQYEIYFYECTWIWSIILSLRALSQCLWWCNIDLMDYIDVINAETLTNLKFQKILWPRFCVRFNFFLPVGCNQMLIEYKIMTKFIQEVWKRTFRVTCLRKLVNRCRFLSFNLRFNAFHRFRIIVTTEIRKNRLELREYDFRIVSVTMRDWIESHWWTSILCFGDKNHSNSRIMWVNFLERTKFVNRVNYYMIQFCKCECVLFRRT